MNLKTSNIRALILDMDGVLWRGEHPISDLYLIFKKIDELGLSVILATNNSTRSVEQYIEKLGGFGVVLEHWQIVNSSEAMANYLQKSLPDGGPVYIIGETGLSLTLEKYNYYHSYEDAQAVVVGMDRDVTYKKLMEATLLINSGIPFLATNPDKTFPTPEGLVPGAGAILAAIEAATEVKPHNVGKPSPFMYQIALDRLSCAPKETIVVGDRLETDIAGAQSLGCYTTLVLSGVTDRLSGENWHPKPDLIVSDLSHLLSYLENDE